jgi:hypothetical protein
MITYKITNDKLFFNKVVDLDTYGLHMQQNKIYGDINIETKTGIEISTGYFEQDDYIKKFGFKLIKI